MLEFRSFHAAFNLWNTFEVAADFLRAAAHTAVLHFHRMSTISTSGWKWRGSSRGSMHNVAQISSILLHLTCSVGLIWRQCRVSSSECEWMPVASTGVSNRLAELEIAHVFSKLPGSWVIAYACQREEVIGIEILREVGWIHCCTCWVEGAKKISKTIKQVQLYQSLKSGKSRAIK